MTHRGTRAGLVAGCLFATWLGCAPSWAVEERAASEDFLVRFWGSDDGLPQNTVNSIVQTRDGYLWLATFNGLVRFDGMQFRVFDSRNTPELKNRGIVRLFEARNGSLWIGTENGGLYEMREGRLLAHDLGGSFPVSHALNLQEDLQGGIWISPAPGALRRLFNGKVTFHSEDQTGTWMATDLSSNLWVATGKTLEIWEQDHFVEAPLSAGSHEKNAFTAASPRGGIWLATSGGLRRVRQGQCVEERPPAAWGHEPIAALHEDPQGQVWLATFGAGLFLYQTNGAVLHLRLRDGASNERIRCLCEDREGDLWVGLDHAGLCQLRPRRLKVFGAHEGLAEEAVTAVCEAGEGDLWVGTDGGGLYQWKQGRFVRAPPLNERYIQSLCQDRQTNLWVGTYGGGLYRISDGQIHRIERQRVGNVVDVIYPASRGRLWVSAHTGARKDLARLAGGQWTNFTTQDGLPDCEIKAIAEGPTGTLWFGTDGCGLVRYEGGRFSLLGRAEGLPNLHVWSLHADGQGVLWIGTAGSGLVRYFQDNFTQYVHPEGLGGEVICRILEDARANLWTSSYQGIFRISKKSLNAFSMNRTAFVRFTAYGRHDGMPSRECAGGFQPAGCVTRQGQLYFPTVKGLVLVEPAPVQSNPLRPPVLIEKVVVDGETQTPPLARLRPGAEPQSSLAEPGLNLAGWTDGSALRVLPGRRQIEIHYTALSYPAPDKVEFMYKLEGLEPVWVDAGTRRTALYSYIPPGHYVFRVVACNNDGLWNPTGSTLAVTVLPPLWQTSWFIGGAAVLLLAAVAGSARYASTRKLQRRLAVVEQQQVLEKERTRIARDMHDELGSKLTRISFLSEVAKRKPRRQADVAEQIDCISHTSRQALQTLDELVWAVNPRHDSLESLASYLGQYAQEYLQPTKLQCELDIPPELPRHSFSTDLRHNLFLAFAEALNNVLKHAAASRVRVQMQVRANSFLISIQDDGSGFDPASIPLANRLGPGGNGLMNMRARLEELGAQFQIVSAPGKGTRTVFQIPL